MLQESNEITATDRIFEIQKELYRIFHEISDEIQPLATTVNGEPAPGAAERAKREIFNSLCSLNEAANKLDSLRMDLEDGTQELICYTEEI